MMEEALAMEGGGGSGWSRDGREEGLKVGPFSMISYHMIFGGKTGSCDHCDNIINSQHDIKLYVESVHEQTCYQCNQCAYETNTISYLNTHIESTHYRVHVM